MKRCCLPVFRGILCALVAFPAMPLGALQRGDVDNNGSTDISDPIGILNFLFTGGRAPFCPEVANTNGDANVDIGDAVYLLTHLFLGGAAPPALSQEDIISCKRLDPGAIERGMRIYETWDLDNNPRATPFACATCHTMIPDDTAALLLPGSSLHDALRRQKYKNGQLEEFLQAANVCRKDWMTTTLWTADSQDYKDLVTFMELASPDGPVQDVSYEIVCNPQAGPGGDAQEGCRLFNRSCAVCHGQNAQEPPLAISLLDLFVDDLDEPDHLREHIRRSGPNRTDNPDVVYSCLLGQMVMPFFSREKLSDDQVEDLIRFVGAARDAARAGDPPLNCSEPMPPAEGRVLRRGELRGQLHSVSGTVEELDTGRIAIRNFNYDGGGSVVKINAFQAGRIREGRAFGPDLVGKRFTDGTLVVDIPPGLTRDMYDSISIWCVRFNVNFGDALLEPVP